MQPAACRLPFFLQSDERQILPNPCMVDEQSSNPTRYARPCEHRIDSVRPPFQTAADRTKRRSDQHAKTHRAQHRKTRKQLRPHDAKTSCVSTTCKNSMRNGWFGVDNAASTSLSASAKFPRASAPLITRFILTAMSRVALSDPTIYFIVWPLVCVVDV